MNVRYNPFEKAINDVNDTDLAKLKAVSEGWYVEYKSLAVSVKSFAKSLSAFANQYGGWLVIGVKEAADGTRVAEAFPGVAIEQVPTIEAALREASRDCISPSVFYEHRVVVGPATEVGLPEGRAVVVVSVPMGVDAPYVHADGRVYRRISDSSAPEAERDRSMLDALWLRGEKARERLKRLSTRLPPLSRGEKESPFLHLFISADPLGQADSYHPSNWADARTTMKGEPIPFDSFYPRSGGFVARQAKGNPHSARLFSWEFYQEGHSFITVPMAFLEWAGRPGSLEQWLSGYDQSGAFPAVLASAGVTTGRIIDLNFVFMTVAAIAQRHRALLGLDGVRGPFYAKVQLENVWRDTPFLDLASFVDQLREDGVPVVQESNVMCPPGEDLESFVMLPPTDSDDTLAAGELVRDGLALSIPILLALGVSPTALARASGEIAYVGDRARLAQQERAAGRHSAGGSAGRLEV